MPSVDVIIPFFQRSPGPLARAIQSIIGQRFSGPAPRIRILVVDDGAPSPAHLDLSGLNPPDHCQIVVHAQRNAGPGAARNTGLDLATAQYVAFLDSDDEWSSDHLDRGLSTLEAGADLYFSNWLERHGQIGFTKCDTLAGSRTQGMLEETQTLEPDLLDYFFTSKALPLITPALIYRRDRFDQIRFPLDIHVGEDGLFFLELALRSPRVVVSLRPEVTLGYGANIYGTIKWNDPRALWVSEHVMRYHARAYARLGGRSGIAGRALQGLRKQRTSHVRLAVRNLLKGNRKGLSALLFWLRSFTPTRIA